MENPNLEKLFDELRPVADAIKKRKAQERAEGKDFNLFSYYKVFDDTDDAPKAETHHSKFLAEILNPKGIHGAGDKYLRLFLETIGVDYLHFDPKHCNQKLTEQVSGQKNINKDKTEGGSMDIRLEDLDNLLIIENKTKAGDQDNQLIRYDNEAKKTNKPYAWVYLTLDGHAPSEVSVGKSSDVQPICCSYHDHVTCWLEKCIADSSPRMADILTQYLDIVKKLTMQTEKHYDKQQVVDAALASDNILSTAVLLENQDAIMAAARDKYVLEPIRKYAEEQGWKFRGNAYHTKNNDDRWPNWFQLIPTQWKNHYIFYQQELGDRSIANELIGISGTPGKKLSVFRRKNDGCPLGFIDVPILNNPQQLPRMASGEAAKYLIEIIQKAYDQAEEQAKKDGFEM